MLSVHHNPRVIAADLAPRIEQEMQAAGVSDYGVRVMSPKARHVTLAVENVTRLHANLIKQHALSLGAEAAVDKHIPTESVETTTLILSCTLSQMERLLAKLAAQPFGLPALADVLAETVSNYQCRTWALRCDGRALDLGPAPVVMGILNVTPDSFSDGGQFADAGAAVDRALELIGQGAAVIDVGGESTRPGSATVPPPEEIARVVPVISGLRKQTEAVISIDTRKAAVAEAALDAGADAINDISALGDPAMGPLAAARRCPVVLMHMQGDPATMQRNPNYRDVVADVARELRRAAHRAVSAGVDEDQIVLDPGIGFGKTLEHNLALLSRLAELRSLGRPILVGTSRKSFIGKLLDADPHDRLMGTIATSVWTRAQGAAIFRVHDVAEVAQALRVAAAVERMGEPH